MRMTLIIPASWWSVTWQWNIQSPGVIGDERDFDGLARRHEKRIPPLSKWVRFAVTADNAKAVAVQMHRVPPRRLVAQRQHAGLAALERYERRHVRLAVPGHRRAVHRPSRAAHAHHPHATHHAHAAHHAALQRDLVALGSGKVRLGEWVGW